MIKKIIILILIVLPGFLSCYDALDTYENGIAYNLRDRGPAGGWIFYINPNYKADGWRYLEAAPVETEWSGKRWSTNITTSIVTSTGVGSGKANTSAIVTYLNSIGESDRAAQLCDSLVYGGYSDWFLPSADELKEMCWVLYSMKYDSVDNPAYGSNRVGGFQIYYYWSSSEDSLTLASVCRFSSGEMTTAPKGTTSDQYVRAIRAF